MSSLTKAAALVSLAALGLAALPSQAANLVLPYSYSFLPGVNGPIENLTISDPYTFTLTGVTVTETALIDPTLTGTTNTFESGNALMIAPGGSISADTGANLPTSFALPFGPQPQNTLFDPQNGPLPFTLSATATGSGNTYSFSLTQNYNPDGSPAPIAAVPETSTMALLAGGLGLLGLIARRKRLA